MLPATYQLPAGLLLLLGGLLACFFGYRLFRLVLTVYGFILGALFASSLVAPNNTVAMVLAVVVGGLSGALIMFAGYFAGVMIVGAGLTALVAHTAWMQFFGRPPGTTVVVVAAIVGAVLAWSWQRYAIILGTAFGGARTAIAGVLALMASRLTKPTGDEVWIGNLGVLPITRGWHFLAWLALGVAGTLVQFATGKPSGSRKAKYRKR
jgi:hypothetical protein